MESLTFEAWRKAEKLTQAAAAEKFGVSRNTIIRWESGASPVPQEIAEKCGEPKMSEPERMAAKAGELKNQGAPKSIDMGERRAATHAGEVPHAGDPRRFVMEPGLSGIIAEKDWQWPDLTDVPKGVWRKILDPQKRLANGSIITAIDYHSNGVGSASMVLRGANLDKGPLAALEGIQRGAYRPFRARPDLADNLKAGDTKTAKARAALEQGK